MSSSAGVLSRPDAGETWSPELVLVDQRLAVHARERLGEPDDTLARLEEKIWLHRIASLDAAAADGLSGSGERRRLGAARRARTRRRGQRGKLVIGMGTMAALLVAVVLGTIGGLRSSVVERDVEKASTRTIATSTRPDKAAVPDTAASESAPARGKPAGKSARRSVPSLPATRTRENTPRARRFAWAPVADASGYRVEFFRGTVRIYSGRTTDASVALPTTWRFQGRTFRLTPGTYRWYVWPIASGLRQPRATVQAELVVP